MDLLIFILNMSLTIQILLTWNKIVIKIIDKQNKIVAYFIVSLFLVVLIFLKNIEKLIVLMCMLYVLLDLVSIYFEKIEYIKEYENRMKKFDEYLNSEIQRIKNKEIIN